MSLVKYNPLRNLMTNAFDVDRFFDDFWFGDTDSVWSPTVDIAENENSYEIKVDVPGMKKKDLNISFKDNVLTLSGEKKEEKEDKGKNFFRKERVYGKFQRSFRIPQDIDPEKIKAKYEDGVLTVEVPKTESTKAKEIAIN
ncbi:Hsp20/alpha crystallin family protein [candidate division KSB1 bacterium]|nr:MAG: Hsp20/alpha crystallin family protein [candidate division KSB1 bacterium]